MKHHRLFLTTKVLLFLGVLFLLSSCAPAPSLAPSGALKTQLLDIKQQQQNQADLLQQLQQQLTLLQKQLGTQDPLETKNQNVLNDQAQMELPATPITLAPEMANQFSLNQEVVTVAASASSYLAAFSNLAAGHLPAAEAGFQEFLKEFPGHQYSPNALYWLANAQLSQGKINSSITNFQLIIANPNAQAKAPAAYTQLAQIYRQDGQIIQADNILEQLRNRYPESPEAQQLYRSNEPIN